MPRFVFSMLCVLIMQQACSEVVLYNRHIQSPIPICGGNIDGTESVAKQQAVLQQFSRSSLLLLKNETPPSAAGSQEVLPVMPEEQLNQRFAYLQSK